MQLHLFSSPGESGIELVVDACRPYFEGNASGVLAYIPAGTPMAEAFYPQTQDAFRGLANVALIDATTASLHALEEILNSARAVCLPGGNTYLMSQRLHRQGYYELLRKFISDGLPVVAFSAGTVFCGLSVLTSNDVNECGISEFSGLGVVPFNFSVHYPGDDIARTQRDRFLQRNCLEGAQSVLALEDGTHLVATEARVSVVRGRCWLFQEGRKMSAATSGMSFDLFHG